MTTIPDYLILMAVAPTSTSDRTADLPDADGAARQPASLSIRGRLGRRLARVPAADARALATSGTITPPLRDYPYRATC